jgi:2-polyprenyl-6-hydroxyphenyl methylase/3-demethylubiquinone-9 3-methyltransferase
MDKNLNRTERVRLHSHEYAEAFERKQDPMRLGRLLPHISLPSNATIGDFGCGNALMLEFLQPYQDQISRYYGVDFSSDLLQYAIQRKERLQFQCAEFFAGSIQEFCLQHLNQLDVALAMDLSEHVYDAEWLEILTSIYQGLKKGGRLYLHTPNATFFLEIMKAHHVILKQFPEHIAVRTAEQNKQLLHKAGFENVTVTHLPHYNKLKYIHPLSRLPGVGKYFQARLFLSATKSEETPHACG